MKPRLILAAALLAVACAPLLERELAPAAEKPAAPAAEPAAAPVTNLTFATLSKTLVRMPPEFPDELRSLDGKRVRITGFVMPYDDPEKLQKLLLVETPGGCFFCAPPNANALLFVRRDAKDGALAFGMDPVTFDGTLSLWHAGMQKSDEARQFLFTLNDARVQRSKRAWLSL